MLKLTILGDEFFNQKTSEFVTIGDVTIELEHSLLSLSKWEAKYEKPFLGPGAKTTEDILGYIRCMIITPNFDENLLYRLSQQNLDQVNDYINAKQTATTFGAMPERKGRGEIITAELIYYWMVEFNIPFSCETWHINKLFALIRVCNIKKSKPKQMSRADIAARNQQINADRKARLGTSG